MTVSRNTKKETLNIEKMIAEFASPLDSYQAVEVETNDEAAEKLDKISNDLSQKTAWKTKYDAIKHLMELLKGGIQYYPGGNLQELSPLIASAVLDLRAIIVRASSILVAAAAQLLGEDFEGAACTIFPALLKQISSKNPVISNYCHLALLEIVKHCTTKKVGKLFLANSNSKVTFCRQIAAESCHIINETWPGKISSSMSKEVSSVIEALSTDKDEVVRNIANEAISVSRESTPKKKKAPSTLVYSPTSADKKPLSPITKDRRSRSPSPTGSPNQPSSPRSVKFSPTQSQQTPQQLKVQIPAEIPSNLKTNEPLSPKSGDNQFEKETQNLSPHSIRFNFDDQVEDDTQSVMSSKSGRSSQSNRSKREVTIEDVMDPSTKKEATLFKAFLDDHVQRFDFNPFLDRKRLVSSVIYAAQQIPIMDIWKDTLSILLDQFPEDFAPHVISLMSCFSFNEWIYEQCASIYSAQAIAETLITGRRQKMSDAFNFFVVAFRTKTHVIDLNDKLKSMIQVLIQSNIRNDETVYLKEAIERAEASPTVDAVLDKLILRLKNNEPWNNDLNVLAELYDQSPQMITQIETVFNDEVPKLISRGTDNQRQDTIEFIIECCGKLRKISFATSVDPIVAVVLDGNCKWEDAAIECLAKMMIDIKALAISIALMENGKHCEQIIVEALLIYFTEAPPQRLLPVQKILVSKLLPFLSSETAETRKTVILIFAEFKRKIPKEFGKLLKKRFTPTQRKLIEMSALKARPVRK
ncbi:hypothetical protein TRFO_05056 [Tritrichomonas foetus]|uniref:TOG domain-containing protein n=1 Tax=Tritrichomonas foetus TaxID=1144522 RepID=A0A1J4KAE8_9EUKA|nr:hypothetical protein TRFO_05056 [Tritrichomonas foetus]|eukprot:OHT07938.1 hypothetical protein TRFO_05056 [Tritrichomonas foetus]